MSNRRWPTFFSALLLALLWAGAGAGQAAEPPGGAEAALRQGIELYRQGQAEEARTRLQEFVRRHAESPLLPEAHLYLARIFLEQGAPEEALRQIERLPEKNRRTEAELLEGVALSRTERAAHGVDLLQSLDPAALTEPDRRLRLQGLVDGNLRQGRPLPALLFVHQLVGLPGGTLETDLAQAHALLRDRLSDTELGEAAFMLAGTPIGEDARLQQALRAFARGEKEEAQQLAAAIVRANIPSPFRREAVLLLERLAGREPPVRTIGVLLPLTGRYGAFGQLVRRGMELALQMQAPPSATLLFRDEVDAERAAQAVTDLVQSERVIGIAGPLTGGAAEAAALRAEELQVPLLALSQRDGLAELGDYVFRNSLTSRLQVEALADYALAQGRLRTFGMLVPENKLGREMAELFSQAVSRRGGRVVAQQSYAENATDFRAQIRRLQGKDPAAEEGGAPPFAALFIPDYADRVALIAPQLAYYGLEGVQLLGINGWNSPELLGTAGRFLEGAVFPDGFFRESPSPPVAEFVRRYRELYGEDPSILEAQGFDVAGILLRLLADPQIVGRDDLRQAMSRLSAYPGVTGVTTFDPQGEAQKVLFLLQVQDGQLVQLN